MLSDCRLCEGEVDTGCCSPQLVWVVLVHGATSYVLTSNGAFRGLASRYDSIEEEDEEERVDPRDESIDEDEAEEEDAVEPAIDCSY